MTFHGTFCDPFSPDVVDLGILSQDQVLAKFHSIRWLEYLEQMKLVGEEDIHFSPSLEVEDQETEHSITISVAGEPDEFEFYIFYKRPRIRKVLFGLSETTDEYLTDITGQTENDATESLQALLKRDYDFLDRKVK